MGGLTLTERQRRNFWAKVAKTPDGCWEWTGTSVAPPHHEARYGSLTVWSDGRPRTLKAHRVAYALAIGDPGALHVLHSCDNTLCVRPGHLFLGTHRDNMEDMAAKGRDGGRAADNRRKTHCLHGHSLSGGNLYINPRGQRQCRACRREACRRYRTARVRQDFTRGHAQHEAPPTAASDSNGRGLAFLPGQPAHSSTEGEAA